MKRVEFANLVTDVLDAGRELSAAWEWGTSMSSAEKAAKKAHEATMAPYDAQVVRIAALTAQRDAALDVCKATVIGIEDALDAGGELEDSVWHPAVRKAWLQAKAIIEVQKEK